MVTVLNFSHPITTEQRKALEGLIGEITVIDIPCRVSHNAPFAEQAADIVDRVPFDREEWQTKPILLCLPGYAPIAGCILAEVHGRTGYFPAIVRLRPIEGAATQFEVAEIINLQAIRDRARNKRFE